MAKNTAVLQVEQGCSQFTTDLYKVLSQEEGNVLFSPISAHAVLSMAYQGAQGTTAECLANALQVPQAKTAAEGYNKILKCLNSEKYVRLLMANKVFLSEGHKLLKSFRTTVTKHFLSEVQQVNFRKKQEAAKIINSWVEKQTRNKIKGLISKDSFDDSTSLVLVNAIYFKGDWLHKFDKDLTKTEPFYLDNVETVDVQMMHICRDFYYNYDASLNAKVLQLPYASGILSMFIILPNERNGVRDLEQKLATVGFSDIKKNMRLTEVNVALPKFKLEQTIDLKDSLSKLGLGEIFDKGKANFRGMMELGPDKNLFVGKVIQKAFIEVNEEGAEAGAGTFFDCFVDSCLTLGKQEIFFTADHPFIFLLTHGNETSLFVGKILKFDLQVQ